MTEKRKSGAPVWTDPDDAPELTAEFFDTAQWAKGGKPIPAPPRRGRPKAAQTKVPVTIRLDPAVVEHFKATGDGWQSRINAALVEDIRAKRA